MSRYIPLTALGCLATIGYLAYVCVTHGDGVALAAFMGFLGLLGGWLCAGRKTA